MTTARTSSTCAVPPDSEQRQRETSAGAQLLVVLTLPGLPIVMTPPHAHMHVHVDVNAGMLPICVSAAPGTHGPVTTGMHGAGVSTPMAADVAAATAGLDGVVHIPNGGMFVIGTMSCTVPAGLPSTSTRFVGNTLSVDGAMPKLHVSVAVAVTFGGIGCLPVRATACC
jgi:hypothetical protein